MAIDLPAGAAGIKSGNNPTPEAEQVVEANENSLWQDIAALPGGIYAAATGEGVPIEFPNIPETTDMGDAAPGFFEAFMMNNKLMFARDDFGKAEIMEDAFGDDERWGGAFVDKFDNPMIVWNDKPYYVNKPGFSGQDVGTFTGEILKFLPASKFVSGAKTVGGTIMRGTGAYSAECAIYYSNSFDLETRLQSEDRCHRIGTKNNVTYIDIEAPKTIDSKIIKALQNKKSLADVVTKDPMSLFLTEED